MAATTFFLSLTETAEEVVLLDFKDSMFEARVRIALNEKEIKYDHKEEKICLATEVHFLKMNQIHKRMPFFIHNGKPISECLRAVEYIDYVWKDKAPLLPSDPYARAQARFWADFIDNKLYGITRKITLIKGEEHETGKKDFIEGLKLLDGALGEGPYFGGENFGYLDIAFIGFSSWFYTYETFGIFSIEAECPKLIAWAKRCRGRSSVSKSLADPLKVHDFVLQLKKVLGFE